MVMISCLVRKQYCVTSCNSVGNPQVVRDGNEPQRIPEQATSAAAVAGRSGNVNSSCVGDDGFGVSDIRACEQSIAAGLKHSTALDASEDNAGGDGGRQLVAAHVAVVATLHHAGGSTAMVVSVVGVVVVTSVDVSSLDLVGVFAPLLGKIMTLATTQKMVALRLVPVVNVIVAV
ncbi:hypothetical protein PHYPSEUDO_004675 [Phytophthora pseudosyringae]|uniref:Uncharacterized protein n=1 Tax=Phytophthora pseudosyringae TaxID=221518 RepID=A0A8T1VT34_9STRA|nr:hypothetical protein PHYPSEUDO_004675 [Phytophthora pseudosyringae]